MSKKRRLRKPHTSKPKNKTNQVPLGTLLSPFRKMLPLAPLAIGAAVAGTVHSRDQERAEQIQNEIDSTVAEVREQTTRTSVKVGLSALQNPEVVADITERAQDGGISKQDRREIGISLLREDPTALTSIVANAFAASARINRLRTELQEVEDNMTGRATNAFMYTTGALYLVYLPVYLRNRIASMFMAKHAEKAEERKMARKARKPHRKKKPEKKPPESQYLAPVDTKPTKVKREKPAEADDVQGEFDKIVSKTAPKKKKKRNRKKGPKKPQILGEETSDVLSGLGFNPLKAEQAMIRAFRILSPTSIYIAMRYAQTPDVLKGIRAAFKDEAKSREFMDLLKKEGMLQYHKGTDCVSLEPKPTGELGNQILNDIQARVVDVQRAGKKNGS